MVRHHPPRALAAVKAVGKPVRAILITHAHPDHYTGLGLFRQAFPGVPVYSSKATADAIRYDTFAALEQGALHGPADKEIHHQR